MSHEQLDERRRELAKPYDADPQAHLLGILPSRSTEQPIDAGAVSPPTSGGVNVEGDAGDVVMSKHGVPPTTTCNRRLAHILADV